MNAARQASIESLYITDLDRYLFAPSPRVKDHGSRRWNLRPAAEWLSRWFEDSRQALSSLASVLPLL